MPQWPSDWSGILKPALDIQKPTSSTRLPWKCYRVEEKDIQITLDNDVLMVRGESARTGEEGRWLPPCGASLRRFQRALNLPDDANE